jgi:hypothetical protein
MKNRIPCYVLALLCPLLWGLFACSEDRTAGGTVDGNSIAEVHIDSVKVFADALPAGMDESEIGSTIFWYKINFNGVGEEVFSYEEMEPLFYCSINVYRSEYGVRTVESFSRGGLSLRTFFVTLSDEGVVFHEKLDNSYAPGESRGERDLAGFEKSCEAKGWNLYRHYVDFPEKEIHLTCYTSKDHLTETMDEVLDGYVEKMKQQCMEDK